jgi:hypothetical protein
LSLQRAKCRPPSSDNSGYAYLAYIHQPAGSPQSLNLRYRGIDPTGQLPDSVAFALNKTNEPQKFDVIVFADPQPESALEVGFIRDDVVNALIGNSAAFGMTIGDIMYDDLSLYPGSIASLGRSGCDGDRCHRW